MKLWRSFRVRLALFAGLAISLVFLAIGALVDLRLREALMAEQEARLQVVARRLPPFLRAPGGGYGGGGPLREQLRELLGQRTRIGWIDRDGEWVELLGDWPPGLSEALIGRAQSPRWPEEAALVQPQRHPRGSRAPRPEPSTVGRPRQGPPAPPQPPEPPAAPLAGWLSAEAVDRIVFLRLAVDDSEWVTGGLRLPEGTLWLAQDFDREQAVLTALRRVLLTLLPLALGVVVLLSWWIASHALRPVRRLGEAMSGISERTLDRRLSAADADCEFGVLIERFNAMLERLRRSFDQASRFSADAAHELRTPLTILQGELEAAVQDAAGAAEQARAGSMLEEVGRLRLITDRLLLLARADAGRLVETRAPLSWDRLVAEEVEIFEEAAPELRFEKKLAPATVRGDAALLRQAVRNLLSNAGKYNRPAGGWVEVESGWAADRVRLLVRNPGVPIPLERQAAIFERFARGDAARNRRVDGLGLGLSLAREIARAHGGDLRLLRSDPEATEFLLELPGGPSTEAG